MAEPESNTVEQIRVWIAPAHERERVRVDRLVRRRIADRLKTLLELLEPLQELVETEFTGGKSVSMNDLERIKTLGREADCLMEEMNRLEPEGRVDFNLWPV
ncbi:MAG: hypothetical protein HY700_10900 [Gemmatimonadetes bacterium]|nr:hypothetical protein [Gemmatimonadota bacterium]